MDAIEPWEPEETVGKLWHSWASRFDAPEYEPGEAVALEDEIGRLSVLFRGLGGCPSVEIRPSVASQSDHRLSWRRKLGTAVEKVELASFDGEILRLPAQISSFSNRELNRAAFTWITAVSVFAPAPSASVQGALQRDLQQFQLIHAAVRSTLEGCPGLTVLYDRLNEAHVQRRPAGRLPRVEATLEAAIRHQLGAPSATPAVTALCDAIRASDPVLRDFIEPKRYKPMRPVPHWPVFTLPETTFQERSDAPAPEKGSHQEDLQKSMKAKRKSSDLAEARDSLILHKFESILSFAEFLNLNRRVDDNDPEDAKKALDDLDELALTNVSKAPSTRFKLDLDLAAEDINREAVSGKFVYPEWDTRQRRYLPDHCVVLESRSDPIEIDTATDPAMERRIRRVRRQFEAFRPRSVNLSAQIDGDTLDLNSLLRSKADFRATGEANDKVWCRTQPQSRDLAVSILLDTSRSTESAVTERSVIDIEREALTALAWGLDACGDRSSIHGFSSLRRDRVYVQSCKDFDEPMNAIIERRVGALKPGFYTRMGAAIRHVSSKLQTRSETRRLLLVLTDGKPNDLDHYEGRHGIEDTRMALREARRLGQSVFGIAIDPKGQRWFPRLFGSGHFAVISDPDKLTDALPQIYRQLVGVTG